ncbi:conserved hypothetical protein [Candidatus Sulfopaludibacter sp. SbA3]|nr:conserved hypothetical protein [Candidatus Sulfopaludibacter sp. SbA3]
MLPLVLLLFASATRVQLLDEPFDIPAHEWRYDSELGLYQRAATLIVDYQVKSGGPVRLLLMTHEDEERLSRGKSHDTITSAGPGPSGHLHFAVPQPGDYVLVIDNRDNPGDRQPR